MKDKIQIDVGIGDIVEPINKNIPLFQYRGKPIFEGEISLSVYSPESIFAEKLETVISKGVINSRMKDYHDLLLLIREKDLIHSDKLQVAITKTFQNRDTPFSLIEFEEQGLKASQKLWLAHLKNLGHLAQKLKLPKDIKEVITEINANLVTKKLA